MKTEVFWIDGLAKGRLGIAPRPRGGDWLEDEVKAWRTAGVDSVVSLLTPSEQTELNLTNEDDACRKQDVTFRYLAIPDRGVPQSRPALKRLLSALLSDLNSGKTVVVHCRQGIGRSSLIAASVLTSLGDDPDRAFRRIEQARGRSVPDTDEQRNWVRNFAEREHEGTRPTRRTLRRTVVPKAHA